MSKAAMCKSNKPLHIQVKELLLKEFSGLKPGDRISKTYADYSRQFDTSLVTVQKAMSELAKEKIIAGKPSKGTYLLRKAAIGRNYRLGVIGVSPEEKDPILFGLLDASGRNSCTIEFIAGKNLKDLRAGYLEKLKNRELDGMLLVSHKEYFPKIIGDLNEYGLPYVYVDSAVKLKGYNLAFIDDERASYEAANYLIRKGSRRIAYIGECDDLNSDDRNICMWFRARFRGFVKALSEKKIKYERNYTARANLTAMDGYNAMKILLKRKIIMDGLFIDRSSKTFGAIKAMLEDAPELLKTIQIMSLEYEDELDSFPYRIIGWHYPLFEEGAEAIKLLVGLIEGKLKLPAISELSASLAQKKYGGQNE